MVDRKDIAALLEALCERPLADGQAEPSAELAALYREAAQALSRARSGTGDDSSDADRLTAALAALLSGTDAGAARGMLAGAVPADRLDAQSALAFVDAIEQSPQSAPSHLVDELLAPPSHAGSTGIAPRAVGFWSARRWQAAAACALLLTAGVTSWSVYGPLTNPAAEDGSAQPRAKMPTAAMPTATVPGAAMPAAPPSLADAPAPAQPALATTTAQPCEPRSSTIAATNLRSRVPAAAESGAAAKPKPSEASARTDCALEPHLADRPADHGPADPVGPRFGATGPSSPAAAARTAPAAAPATRPAVPVGAR
jgi:hypothetical protein